MTFYKKRCRTVQYTKIIITICLYYWLIECHPNSVECTWHNSGLTEVIFARIFRGSLSVRTSRFLAQIVQNTDGENILVNRVEYPLLPRGYNSEITRKSIPTCGSLTHNKKFFPLTVGCWEEISAWDNISDTQKVIKILTIGTVYEPHFGIHGNIFDHIISCNQDK